MTFNVQSKVALVTGANRGIGKAIAQSLIDNGASKIYAAVRNLDAAAALVEAYGDKVVPIAIDLNQPETITQAAQTATDVQLVVNNAGILRNANPLAADAIAALQSEMDINVYGLMRMAQAFAPVLKSNGGGAFVQLNSVASMKSFADFATYSASKAAAYSITQALRDILEPQGIQVVSVHPGPISTDMAQDAGLAEMAEPPSLVSEGIIDALKHGKFHLFPDTMAKQIGEVYQPFAVNIVEANLMEG
jgi:NAD(P)-dependent dehydrogenase (short-subunit alcohol dehydrogenase family)